MKLLVISFTFPPIVAPRSIQVARLLRHMDAESVVICSTSTGESLDPTIEPQAEAAMAACIRVSWQRSWLRRRCDSVAWHLNLPLWNRSPDQYRSWLVPAVRAGRKVLAAGFRPDAIVSFGNPMTDHLAGLVLARESGLPWVAHFSDPWTRNPFHTRGRVDEWMNARLERAVVARANLLLFPSAECAEHVLAGAPQEARARSDVLPHSYVAAARGCDEMLSPRIGPYIIRHIGTLYSRRKIAPLMAALCQLARQEPDLLAAVRFEFIGIRDPASLADAGLDQLPPGLVTVRDRVAYQESLELMYGADGLLVLDGAWEGKGIFFPSKLADYIGAGRPILGLSSPGAGAGIIERLGGIVADVTDPAAIADGVRRFILALQSGQWKSGTVWGDQAERDRYAAPAVARLFHQQLSRVIGR